MVIPYHDFPELKIRKCQYNSLYDELWRYTDINAPSLSQSPYFVSVIFFIPCYCKKTKKQFGGKCKTFTYGSKSCFLKCYQLLVTKIFPHLS